jgi:hypothetical protein
MPDVRPATHLITEGDRRNGFSVEALLSVLVRFDSRSDFKTLEGVKTYDGIIALADVAGSLYYEQDFDGCRAVLAAVVTHKIVAADMFADGLGWRLGPEEIFTVAELVQVMHVLRQIARRFPGD